MTDNPVLSFPARLQAGPTAFAAWCGMTDTAAPEGLLRDGYDCAILDWQHGFQDFASIQAGILAVHSTGKPALVRVGVGQFAEAARFLDWGAAGIIAPMVNSVADARALVSFLKYPPLGGRSWGPPRAMGITGKSPGEYLKSANGFSLVIAMIETREALDALDGILAVDGIDGALVGPGDMSIALTNGATIDPLHPEVDKALRHVADRAKKAGKIASAFCPDGARAGQLAGWGFQLLSIATDQTLMRMAGKAELAKARAGAGNPSGGNSSGGKPAGTGY